MTVILLKKFVATWKPENLVFIDRHIKDFLNIDICKWLDEAGVPHEIYVKRDHLNQNTKAIHNWQKKEFAAYRTYLIIRNPDDVVAFKLWWDKSTHIPDTIY